MTTPSTSHDERLREAERRFRESGSPDDEAAWLKERVRVGDLAEQRLRLAAHCGHEGAKKVGAGEQPLVHGLSAWARGLAAFGKAACVVATTEIAFTGLPIWKRSFQEPEPDSLDDHLKAVLAWIACPCAGHLGAVQRLSIVERITRVRTTHGRDVQLGMVISGPERALMAPHGAEGDILARAFIAAIAGTNSRGAVVRKVVSDRLVQWALHDPPHD